MSLVVATAVIGAATAGVLAWSRGARGAASPRAADAVLALLALASLAAWTSFGRFQANGRFVHEWEMFHYQLSASYYAELGHDGLYAASLQAQAETLPTLPLQAVTRDLRTNALAPTPALRAHAEEVKARFTPERWDRFRGDHAVHLLSILEQGGAEWLQDIRRDHGFNATPAWVAAARLFGAGLPASSMRLTLLALIDPLLLALAFLVVARTHGRRTALVALIVFGTGHAWAWHWVGGALLRFDWLVALILGACALRSGRWAGAGACIGYAALVRLFPAAFLLGPLLAAMRLGRQSGSARPLARLIAGFSLAVVAGLLAGSLTGRGAHAWPDFSRNIRKHAGIWLTNNVGLTNVVVYDSTVLAGKIPDDAGDEWGEHLDRARARRLPLLAALALALICVQAVACLRLPPDEALVSCVGIVFATFTLTCYYWVMLVLLCLRGRPGIPLAVIALGLLTRMLQETFGLPLETVYGVMSWALLVLLAGIAIRDVRTAPRRAQS